MIKFYYKEPLKPERIIKLQEIEEEGKLWTLRLWYVTFRIGNRTVEYDPDENKATLVERKNYFDDLKENTVVLTEEKLHNIIKELCETCLRNEFDGEKGNLNGLASNAFFLSKSLKWTRWIYDIPHEAYLLLYPPC